MRNSNNKWFISVFFFIISLILLFYFAIIQKTEILDKCNKNYENNILLKDIKGNYLRTRCASIYSNRIKEDQSIKNIDEYMKTKQ